VCLQAFGQDEHVGVASKDALYQTRLLLLRQVTAVRESDGQEEMRVR
jgi:hypothetical protein